MPTATKNGITFTYTGDAQATALTCVGEKRPSSANISGCPEAKITYQNDTFTCGYDTKLGDCAIAAIGGQKVDANCVASIQLTPPTCPVGTSKQ